MTEMSAGVPKPCFSAPTTDSVWTLHVHGPSTKQHTARIIAPFFQPRAFFITKDRSHMYSSIDSLYFTR